MVSQSESHLETVRQTSKNASLASDCLSEYGELFIGSRLSIKKPRPSLSPATALPIHCSWRAVQRVLLLVCVCVCMCVCFSIDETWLCRDSFWVLHGLLLGEMEETARHIIENMASAILK